MSYLCTIVVPAEGRGVGDSRANERQLACRSFDTRREAKAWVRRNRETWRDALYDHETHFEAWLQDEDGEPVWHIRHSVEYGTEGQEHSRGSLREMQAVTL